MAQDTLDLLDAQDWKQDVHVAGVSMGGMISLELVLADPKRFSSLVLTSTNAGRSPPQLVTISFLTRVILIKNPDARLKLIAETLYPTVGVFAVLPLFSNQRTDNKKEETREKSPVALGLDRDFCIFVIGSQKTTRLTRAFFHFCLCFNISSLFSP